MPEQVYYGFFQDCHTVAVPCNDEVTDRVMVGSCACQSCDNFKEIDKENQFVICKYEENNKKLKLK